MNAVGREVYVESERIILSGGLSSKWNRVGLAFSNKYSAAITRCNGGTREILSLAAHLAPCVVVVEDELIGTIDEDELSQTLDFGQIFHLVVEMGAADGGRLEHLIRIGCSGVLLCSATSAEASRALRAVMKGELWAPREIVSDLLRKTLRETKHHLTVRESEILALVAEGLKNNAIAERLFISPQTVRWHLRSLYAKLGTHDRAKVALGLEMSRMAASERSGTGERPTTLQTVRHR
jgi:DNA-binding NarL/FixJ family response regulator